LGVDGGAYLLSRNAVLFDEPTGAGFPRPPLAPGYLLVPFTYFWGDDIGFKIWTILASTLPVPATYLLSRKFLDPKFALLAAAFVAVDPFHGEMMVTGALPLIGMSLLMVTIWGIIDIVDTRGFTKTNVAAVIVTLALIPYVNQTVAGLTAILVVITFLYILFAKRYIPIYHTPADPAGRAAWGNVVLHWMPKPPFPLLHHRKLFYVLAGGSLVALGALPWYIQVAPNSGLLHYDGPWIFLTSDIAWFQFLTIVPLGIFMLKKGRTYATRLVGIFLITLGTLLIFLSYDETIINIFYRSRYLVRFLFWPALIWVLLRVKTFNGLPIPNKIKPAIAVVGLGLMFTGYLFAWERQTDYSAMITIPSATALEIVKTAPEGHENVVSNSFTMSLWVAALMKVESPHVWTWNPPRNFIETDKEVRCVLGWVEGCDPQQAKTVLNVSHVLIDERFPHYNNRAPGNYLAPPNQWEVTAKTPWLNLIFSEGQTRLYEIN